MATATLPTETPELRLRFPDGLDLSGQRFFEFCVANREARIERTADGEIVIMPPTDSETGRRNADLIVQLGNWARQDGTGLVFDSSTGFDLPNGSTRSPDASWIRKSKLDPLLKARQKGFLETCPDFVIELRSPSDSLIKLKAKMQEYLQNGAELGWLIDPLNRAVFVYRRGQPVEQLSHPDTLSADPPLRGFTLVLQPIWAEELPG